LLIEHCRRIHRDYNLDIQIDLKVLPDIEDLKINFDTGTIEKDLSALKKEFIHSFHHSFTEIVANLKY